ncbi:hypothetical protein CLV91_2234 [Maribacter vaceletii]|uniref:Uncharacterized protein n=1 Tax=Maribacter vaceletii TaxID=1206816 RepID=A0A495E9B4_9FLAO|nr:hypothetical protein [Maribacter vaceletii]RKR13512.1 hypothetical protein CLV91_2234 [Maribacter vaceletii]
MANQQELIQRWDSFLQKIEQRFNESLAHAKEACHEQLVETDYEYETAMRSWSGMKAQINDLIEKIGAVWDTKVQPEMEALGDFHYDENDKGYDLRHKLIYALESFQRKLEGELSQKFYDHAIQIANKKSKCSQCDARIEVKKDIFRAQYITCGYCNAVNTIEPETKFMKIGWGIVDNIVAIICQPEYEIMNQKVDELQALRKSERGDKHWVDYEKAYYSYWEKYFNERIKLNSDAAGRLKADLERKKTEFEKHKEIQLN